MHGFGLQTRWNLKHRVVPVLTREQGVGRGDPLITAGAERADAAARRRRGVHLRRRPAVPHVAQSWPVSHRLAVRRVRPAAGPRDPSPAVVARAARADSARRFARRADPRLHRVCGTDATAAFVGRPRRHRRHPGRHRRRAPASRGAARGGRPARGRVAAGLGRPAGDVVRLATAVELDAEHRALPRLGPDGRGPPPPGHPRDDLHQPDARRCRRHPGPAAQPVRRGARQRSRHPHADRCALHRRPGRLLGGADRPHLAGRARVDARGAARHGGEVRRERMDGGLRRADTVRRPVRQRRGRRGRAQPLPRPLGGGPGGRAAAPAGRRRLPPRGVHAGARAGRACSGWATRR